ncbi:MAG: YihY family inner membrane protein, partial [Gammaproteobacteria bacterium]|nr:YihY family inner membrane protein [Gammaproteobacteria bacterium]
MTDENQPTLDIKQHATRAQRLARHVWKHFQEDRCLEEAASLSYTSLLAMVPLLAVVFGIISAFPVFNEWSSNLQDFIFDNLLPTAGEQIVPYINTFLDSISSLTLPGTILLIVTALMLMIRIEVALNRIWRVDRNRTLVNRITMYWAVLTLGPILIAAAVALSASKVLGVLGMEGGVPPGLYRMGIFFLSWLVFSLFFLLVPNRRVRIKHALAGAFLSTVLFEVAKAGFVAYVSNANYKVIYGALATIPIFLFWLYIVWNVVLFGASLAASLTTFSDFRKYDTDWPKRWEFQLAFRLVGHLWKAQREGNSLSDGDLLELEIHASEIQIVHLMSQMDRQRIVNKDEVGNWLLARDLGELTLGELYNMGDYILPLDEVDQLPRDTDWDRT